MPLRPSAPVSSFLAAEQAVRVARPALVQAGRYDKAAIMREAVKIARQFRTLKSWRRQMALGLAGAWKKAKAAMAAPAMFPTFGARDALTRPAVGRVRPRVFLRGSRAHVHGW